MKFNWKKGILFGLLIWAIMFVVVSILVAYKMPQTLLFTIIVTVASLVAGYLCAKNIVPKNYMEALEYGVIFAIVGIILDFLISKRFAPDIFISISYWVSYILIMLVPLLTVKKMRTEPQNPQQ